MSTVLEKPVLLDETGQEIVDKLDEIKSAISSGGEYIPLAIRVTTPPTKTSYYAGDSLDLSGIVVSLVGSNGSLIDVTSACTFSPANGATLSTSDTNISITYHYEKDNVDFTASQTITVNAVAAISIAVTTPPTKTSYLVGEALDLTGIVVTATFNNGTTSDVTASCIFDPIDGTLLSNESIDSVSITYLSLTASQAIFVVNPIYGVEWDGTATSAWMRTDSAINFVDPNPYYSGMTSEPSSPFDAISPWKDIEVVEDSDAGTLVKIPKFYYKLAKDGSKMKLQISPIQMDGFFVSPAHCDRNDGNGERDFVYVGRYLNSSVIDSSVSEGVKEQSKTGSSVRASMNIAQFRKYCHNAGSDVWQWDYAMYWTIAMLYLVEYADWDSEKKLGGRLPSVEQTGATDNMPYHSGTTGTNLGTPMANGHTQYRYIEDLWCNYFSFLDGLYTNAANVYVILNPSNFSTSSGGTLVGTRATSNGVVSSWDIPSASGYEFALVPHQVATDNTYKSYDCDFYEYYQNGNCFVVGGAANDGFWYKNGLFSFISTDSSNQYYGSRLMKLPNN